MAVSKRKKKVTKAKGKGRVKAAQGGKARTKARKKAPAADPFSIADFIAKLGTGLTQEQIFAQAGRLDPSLVAGLDDTLGDKSAHFVSSQRASDRFGPTLANVGMTGKEVLSGLGQLSQGQKFFGPQGFDREDSEANRRGIASTQKQPRQVSSAIRGKHGGRMTAEAAESGRTVARQNFAAGGFTRGTDIGRGSQPGPPVSGNKIPGISTLPGMEQGPVTQQQQSGTSESSTNTTQNQSGTGFTQNSADTGTLDNIVSQLQNFQGFSGLGRQTLDEVLATGLPTDVSGITAAAKIRAGQEFDDAQNVIGERLANLGLVSSSAQTSAVARERAKLGERVSAAGMEAEVAAREAASNRRFGGIGEDRAGQNTKAGALGQAGSLAGQSAGLNSRQDTGFSSSGSGTSNTTGSTTGQSTSSSSAPVGFGGFGGSSPRQPSFGGGGLGTRNSVADNPRDLGRDKFGNSFGHMTSSGQRFGNQSQRERFGAKGGRVTDPGFENFLQSIGNSKFSGFSNLQGPRNDSKRAGTLRDIAINDLGGEEAAMALFTNPALIRELTSKGAKHGRDTNFGTGKIAATGGGQNLRLGLGVAQRDANVGQGSVRVSPDDPTLQGNKAAASQAGRLQNQTQVLGKRQGFAEGGPVDAPNKGAVPQPTLPQESGQLIPGILDPRRQFFETGGGVAPGVDSGEDQVPALLRSEELVVTPELVDELMNIDPSLPQPGLITALQELAQQPLEFGQEEGEFVAAEGGTVPGLADFIASFFRPSAPGSFDPNLPPSFNGGLIEEDAGLGDAPELDFSGQLEADPGGGFRQRQAGPPIPPELANADTVPFDSGVSSIGRSGEAGLTPVSLGDDFEVPFTDELRPPTFSESVGEAGERKFTLDGGGALAGPLGIEGIRAGLDPSKGLLKGGENFAPGAERGSGSGDNFIGQVTDPATGLPMDFGGQQMSRLDRAQRIADLTRAAITTDPVGGPEKQARMLRALEVANREVDSSVNEIIQMEQLAIQGQQVKNQATFGQAQLNESIARSLQAQASKVTAEGALAKQILEAQTNNPALAAAMNKLEILAKNPDANPADRERILALLQFHLQQAGIEFTESGFLESLFGAPDFAISPSTPQQGIPTQTGGGGQERQGFASGGLVQPNEGGGGAVANDGNQELQALMTRAKAGMSPENFQQLMESGLV